MKSLMGRFHKVAILSLTGIVFLSLSACGKKYGMGENLVVDKEEEGTRINLFGPMEKSRPDAQNTSRTAFDRTIEMAEKELDVTVEYRTYTAENYQEKTYDDVTLDRARHNMDDLYLLNPDTLRTLGEEGKLLDLSGLESARNLRDVIRVANTVDGKLVAIPQEIVVYGLFVNKDLFDQYAGGISGVLPCVSGERHRDAHRRQPLVAGDLCLCPGICRAI